MLLTNRPVFNRIPRAQYLRIKSLYEDLSRLKKNVNTYYYCNQKILKDIQANPNNFWNWWEYFYIPKKDGNQRIIYNPHHKLQTLFKGQLNLMQKLEETESFLRENKIFDDDFQELYHSKVIQQYLKKSFLIKNLNHVVSLTPRNVNSYGFEMKRSIVMNAKQHKDNQYFLKMDIQSAFPSIKRESIFKIMYFYERKLESMLIILKVLVYHFSINQLIASISISQNKFPLIKKCEGFSILMTFNDSLVTGSALSPWILNKYLYKFDECVQGYCQKRNLTYTRYADDLTISSQEEIPQNTRNFIKHMLENWGMNENAKKTCIQSYKRKNVITGIVVSYNDKTKEGHIGIGYKRFNELKKNLYLLKQGKLTSKEENKTFGMLSFLRSVDKERYDYLMKKYDMNLL